MILELVSNQNPFVFRITGPPKENGVEGRGGGGGGDMKRLNLTPASKYA